MRIRYIATFAETIRTDATTLAREYLSARDAKGHEFSTDEARSDYVAVLLALGRFQHRTAFARALAELDVNPAPVEAESSLADLMRPVAWNFGEGTTFPGYTDDTRWNGFLNVWVTPATCNSRHCAARLPFPIGSGQRDRTGVLGIDAILGMAGSGG